MTATGPSGPLSGERAPSGPRGKGSAPTLASATCLERLAFLGIGAEEASSVDWEVTWFGPARVGPARRGSEATVQAMSGLMGVNGWDDGLPRRIGLDVASVGAGMLAALGVLATLIGRSRGRPETPVGVSVLQAGLLLCSHYIAAATSGDELWLPPTLADPAPGPPFCTSDGHWFEMDSLDPEVWRAFWEHLGLTGPELGRAWAHFRPRYFEGRCSLPATLHEATARYTLADMAAIASTVGMSLCPLRSYPEVLTDVSPAEAHPALHLLGPAAAPMPPAALGALPLDGLTVVEATTRMQGPLATLLARMLGARVLKVEPPGGDIGRMVSPLADDVGSFFRCWNRGKDSVEIDLTKPSGRDELGDVIAHADAFVHNWRPGKAEEWALGPSDLACRHPGLVYAQASGWGSRADRRGVLGLDFLVQAFAGFGDGLNPEADRRRNSMVLLTDFLGALVTCEGLLAGLYQRCGDGLGRRVETSLLAGALTLEGPVLDGLRSGREVGRRAGRPEWDLLDRPIAARDGWLVVTADDDDDLRRLARVCGLDPAGGDRAAVAKVVTDRIGAGSAHGWERRLVDAGLPAAVAVEDLARLPGDPALADLFEPVASSCRVPTSPWSLGP